jgi:hypothetical protein
LTLHLQAKAETEIAGKSALAEVQTDILEELSIVKEGAQQQFDSIVRVFGEALIKDMEAKVRVNDSCLVLVMITSCVE